MNLLIPYVPLYGHPDPLFDEFTYGDGTDRGRKLRRMAKGSYAFFHTTQRGRKVITAYYIVDRVLPTANVAKDPKLSAKFKNPHIEEFKQGTRNDVDDTVLFGDPITSRVLPVPLPFSRQLSERLSLNIKFSKDRTETQCIGSATRSWRNLTDKDVDILLKEIGQLEAESGKAGEEEFLSTDEVAEVLERDIENYIVRNPFPFGNNPKLARRQKRVSGGRTDLIFHDANGNLFVVELKLNLIGHQAVDQIRKYIRELRKETGKEVSGAIVCKGVMPAFQGELKKVKDVKIFRYGWQLKIQAWEETA